MTKFVEDSIKVDMTIDGDEWLVSEAEVVLSRNRSPNYAQLTKIAPGQDTSFSSPQDLLGSEFSLEVDSELTSYRNAPGEYNNLLFEGNIANITSRGTGVYEATAYDPSQQAINGSQEGGSVMGQTVELQNPQRPYSDLSEKTLKYASIGSETTYTADTVVYRASKALNQVLEVTPIEETEIQLSDTGKVIGGPRGQFRGALDVFIKFDESETTVGEALKRIADRTKSFWWFDREGKFYFGVPDANVHYPELITDTSAGLTTPPYQSIKVIGSDLASEQGYGASEMNPGEPIVVGGDIVIGDNGEPILNEKTIRYGEEADLTEPTFTYRSQEIITELQAKNFLEKLATDLGEQYASGSVKTVGYPEPQIFDIIVMPHANSELEDRGNYNPRQPMGGSIFGIYEIRHRLNPSDGFKTEISVAGMSGPASVKVTPDAFLSEPSERSSTESAGAEFDGVDGPPSPEQLREQAERNAIAELVSQGSMGVFGVISSQRGTASPIERAPDIEDSSDEQEDSRTQYSDGVGVPDSQETPQGRDL